MATVNQWAKIAKRNKERLRLVAQEGYVYLGSDIIARSPVDEGTFRNNWFSNVNSASTQTTTRKAKKGFGEKGGARYTDLLHVSTQYDVGDTLYFTNSLPYARRLEYGHSQKMAPHGMVRLATANWPMIITNIAKKIT